MRKWSAGSEEESWREWCRFEIESDQCVKRRKVLTLERAIRLRTVLDLHESERPAVRLCVCVGVCVCVYIYIYMCLCLYIVCLCLCPMPSLLTVTLRVWLYRRWRCFICGNASARHAKIVRCWTASWYVVFASTLTASDCVLCRTHTGAACTRWPVAVRGVSSAWKTQLARHTQGRSDSIRSPQGTFTSVCIVSVSLYWLVLRRVCMQALYVELKIARELASLVQRREELRRVYVDHCLIVSDRFLFFSLSLFV